MAWEGHLSREGSRDLGAGKLSCMNGFVIRECPNSCAYGMGWQCLALTLEWRLWRVKRISGAYCTQMDLFNIYSREVGWGGLNPPCPGGRVKSLWLAHVGSTGLLGSRT